MISARVLRLVPGATGQPSELVQRRLLVGLTIVGLSMILQTVPTAIKSTHVPPVLARFGWSLVEMLTLTFALSLAYDWHQRRRASTTRTLGTLLVIAAVIATGFLFTYTALTQRFPGLRGEGPPKTLGFSFAFGVVMGLLHSGVWALAFVFPYVAEDARMRAMEADKLRIEAEQLKSAAELARLRSQLEPHFLLNTLNAIAGLVTENPREARRLIACLGDLLRDSLNGEEEELQPLEAEVAWLRRYAQILESRHGTALSFNWEIEPSARAALVPRLLLQPLVENAVKHGALRRREGGLVTVRAAISGGQRVVCTVEDNGPGLPDAEPRAGAFGLKSVRRRLALRFPDAELRMESSGSGTRSIVELPAHPPTEVA
jgi:signal transduction histidine kinase